MLNPISNWCSYDQLDGPPGSCFIELQAAKADWQFFDITVRHLIAKQGRQWNEPFTKEMMAARVRPEAKSYVAPQNVGPRYGASMDVPKGYCVPFHKYNDCKDPCPLKYSHRCLKCKWEHRAEYFGRKQIRGASRGKGRSSNQAAGSFWANESKINPFVGEEQNPSSGIVHKNAVITPDKVDRLACQRPTLKKTLRLIPIHPEDQYLFCINCRDRFYIDRALQMGCSSSCQIFQAFASAINWISEAKLQIPIVNYLDDFKLGAANKVVGLDDLQKAEKDEWLCEKISSQQAFGCCFITYLDPLLLLT